MIKQRRRTELELRGKFVELKHIGANTDVYEFYDEEVGLFQIGVCKSILIDLDKDYILVASIHSSGRLNKERTKTYYNLRLAAQRVYELDDSTYQYELIGTNQG